MLICVPDTFTLHNIPYSYRFKMIQFSHVIHHVFQRVRWWLKMKKIPNNTRFLRLPTFETLPESEVFVTQANVDVSISESDDDEPEDVVSPQKRLLPDVDATFADRVRPQKQGLFYSRFDAVIASIPYDVRIVFDSRYLPCKSSLFMLKLLIIYSEKNTRNLNGLITLQVSRNNLLGKIQRSSVTWWPRG